MTPKPELRKRRLAHEIEMMRENNSGIVQPLFLSALDYFSPLAESIRANSPRDVLNVARQVDPNSRAVHLDYLCMVSADGRILSLASMAQTKWKESEQPLGKITESFLVSGVAALSEGRRGYDGSFVCSLQDTGWPRDISDNVARFIERIVVGRR